MYSHEAVRIAQPFLRGEYENIFKAIKLFPDKYKTFVVIGCGPAVYFKVSQDKNLQYIGIEPEIESFRHEINAILENKELGAIFFKKKLEKIKELGIKVLIRRLIDENSEGLVRHSAKRITRIIYSWYKASDKHSSDETCEFCEEHDD